MEQKIGQSFDHAQVVVDSATERDHPALRVLFEMGCVEGHVPGNDTGADIANLQDAYFSDDGHSHFWVARWRDEVIGMVGVQRHSCLASPR